MSYQIKFTTVQRRVGDLIPMAINPRQMTVKENDDLEKSMAKFDLAEIPVINTDNTIVAGHQRIRILIAEGRADEMIDVRLPSRDMTEDEVKEYCVRSNANRGSWDFDFLANHFEATELVDWGFEPFELGIVEPIVIEPNDNDEKEPDKEPKETTTQKTDDFQVVAMCSSEEQRMELVKHLAKKGIDYR